eukprot:TRINITY_DN1526_c0_g1_i2.p2 TRINITY_DN1526_c0_g1~~TRINITY_DN1526_c0_g1_i2.p2  ORF type:complete len:108 (+),score=36.55 TRINITY_DN1526_c0_g1_i2:333-656(+)
MTPPLWCAGWTTVGLIAILIWPGLLCCRLVSVWYMGRGGGEVVHLENSRCLKYTSSPAAATTTTPPPTATGISHAGELLSEEELPFELPLEDETGVEEEAAETAVPV